MDSQTNMPEAAVSTPVRRYSAHRVRQRGRILKAAQGLFNQQGIDRVTIADIVTATGVQPTTLYEYFANKDEIVWALVEEYAELSTEYLRERMSRVPAAASALAQIQAMLWAFEEELAEHPDRARLQSQFDAMYAHEWSAAAMVAVLNKVTPAFLTPLSDLIRRGVADGSLRPDLIPSLTMHAILSAVVAVQRRFASLGNRVESEYGQPVRELFHETIRIILLGVTSNHAQSSWSTGRALQQEHLSL